MKRLDFIIIAITLVVIIAFYTLFFINQRQSSDYLVIKYNNNEIYEVNINDDATIKIEGFSDGRITIDDSTQKITITAEVADSFTNEIIIASSEVTMISASCKNKDCMKMKLTKLFNTPIVCTNGIIIMMKTDDFEIIV